MSETMMREKVHRAVDGHCAHLREDAWLTQRVIAMAKKEENQPVERPQRRSKLSVALVVALVLVLLTATAAAAVVLSMRQLVEEKVVPLANEYEGDSFTLEDTSMLVQIAQENGIELSENAMAWIRALERHGEGYYKDELILDFAKAEFGQDVDAWTLEQKKWFDDMRRAMGYEWDVQYDMPEGGEEAKHPIIAAAKAHIWATYDSAALLDDPEQYTVSVAYMMSDDPVYEHIWSVELRSRTVENSSYILRMADDASVIECTATPGLREGMRVDEIYDLYELRLGSSENWGQGTLRIFQAAAMTGVNTDYKDYLCLKQTTYPDIPADAIPVERAREIAVDYLGFMDYLVDQIYFIGDEPNPVWKMRVFASSDFLSGPDLWTVEIDCITGEVKQAHQLDYLHRKWWMYMVLWEISEDVETHWVDNSPSVG